jgi:2-polyprenyl-3-methyl-5-hydroxy-6-metoxy-1,4-benzoquinol methylase
MQTQNPSNVSPDEIARFEKLAARWWDPDGESRPLHDLNPVRAAYVGAARGWSMSGAVAACSARHWPVPARR